MSNEKEPSAENSLLIVDDEQGVRDVFRQVVSFSMPECQVDTAVNGEEAVQMFNATHYKVILMDLSMPVMDGETAFQEISKMCDAENIVMPAVVFCSGYAPSDELMDSVEESDLHCLIKKPVMNDALVGVLQEKMVISS